MPFILKNLGTEMADTPLDIATGRRLPPVHPGGIVREDCLKPLV